MSLEYSVRKIHCCKCHAVGRLGMNGRNNTSEPLIITVRCDKPKALTGLGQNGKGYSQVVV